MEKSLVFLDIETTGLNPDRHELIEIAAIKITSAGTEMIFYEKVHPQHLDTANKIALEINGYSPKLWRGAKDPIEISAYLEEFLDDCILIGHNIQFDISFLSELMHQNKRSCPWSSNTIDTIVLAHEHLSCCGLHSLSMDSIRHFMNWTETGSHRALKDAKDVKRLYYRLLRANFIDRLVWTYRDKIFRFLGLKQ